MLQACNPFVFLEDEFQTLEDLPFRNRVAMFYTDDFMMDVMGIRALPETLFHYTSIEALAQILASRSLRFSRLDSVNDPEEALACDLPQASTLVFASCWTAQERESLAMWRMYTPDMQGVRIQLPNNPFRGRHRPEVFSKGGWAQLTDDLLRITRKGGGEMNTRSIVGPNKIFYTDDFKYRNVQCLLNQGDSWTLQLYDLGMVKNTHWAFEEEWRYTVLANTREMVCSGASSPSHPWINLEDYPVATEALFVSLDPTSLESMEVLLGPCVTDGQKVMVEALITKYAPNAVVRRSEIKVRLPR